MKQEVERYLKAEEEINKLLYALSVVNFDLYTICPSDDKIYSSEVCDYLNQKILDITTDKDYIANIEYLYENRERLDELLATQIRKEYEEISKIKKIPYDILLKHYANLSRASLEWEKARNTLDYRKFENELEELVNYLKYYAKEISPDKSVYNTLIHEMENDFTIDLYDDFFNRLELEVLPLMKQALKAPKKYNPKLASLEFPIDKQRELTKKVCQIMGYDNNKGYIGETIHPFTSGFNHNDVRTTTNYSVDSLFSNLYSVMHEVGHALYELGNASNLTNRYVFGGASCALHESQSRFYENYLGRRRSFIEFIYPTLKELFSEELRDITVDDLYYYVNDVQNGFIRVDADELTYPFHILVRYKVEKDIFENNIEISDISKKFDDYFEEFFGVRPSNKKEGAFQDIHWSGSFGYFPTYALGSAIAASIFNKMSEEVDIDGDLSKGDFTNINNWLKDKVHKYGASKSNLEIIKIATGKDFDPSDYINYLIKKFS